MRIHLLICTLFSVFCLTVPVWAAPPTSDIYDIPKPVAIQGRKYEMSQSFVLSAGYIPTDTFNTGYPFSVGYRYGFNSYLAWEVFNFSYVLNHETQTKRDLNALAVNVQNVGLGGKLDYPRQLMVSGLHYSPLYAKNLLFNSQLFYSETSLYLGMGAIVFNASGTMPTIAPGLSTRLYLSPNTALNLYIKDYFFKDPHLGVNGILDFGIGFEYKFALFGGATHAER